jgi:hypothetical protein
MCCVGRCYSPGSPTCGLKVGDDYVIRAKRPPCYPSIEAAVDDVVAHKFGSDGVYHNKATFERIYRRDYGERS